VNILATMGTPPVPDLEALGVARVSLGSGPMRKALAVVREVARELKHTGTYGAFTDDAMSFNEVNELMK
jgi:2-methylisocitrate lyase-like PEP mutase family enzyme